MCSIPCKSLDSTQNLDTGYVYMLAIEMFPGILLPSLSIYDSELKQPVLGLSLHCLKDKLEDWFHQYGSGIICCYAC